MNTTNQNILLLLLKDFSTSYTPSIIAKTLHKSRWGIWKNLREMEQQELITLHTTGTGKTSTRIIKIRWTPLTQKTLSFALAQESAQQKRWQFTFAEIESTVDFFVLYGSTIHALKNAGDIDVFSVSKEKKMPTIRERIQIIQKTQEKNIHVINFTEKEFTQELKNSNNVFIDALKKGTVLFGQDEFVQFIKRVHQ